MGSMPTMRDIPSSETLPVSTFTLLVCGLGFYLGWQTVGISPTLFPQPVAGIEGVVESASYYQTVSFLLLLLVLAGVAYKRGSLLSCKPLVVAAVVLPCLSTACTYLCGWVLDVPAGVVIGMLLNASKAVLLLLWAECLCRIRFRDALLCVALAYVVVFTLCLLVAGLKETAALIVHSLFPLFSGGALFLFLQDRSFSSLQSGPGAASDKQKSTLRLPMRLFLGIGLFGAVILVTNMLSETKSSATAELCTLLAGLAVAIVVAAFARRQSEKFDFTFLYRMLTPLIIISVMPVLTLEGGNQQYEAFVIGIAWAFFRIFTWTLWCSIALRSGAPAACVFALGQFALTSCSTIAQFVSDVLIPVQAIPLPIMISIIIVLAVGTSAFVMSESDIRKVFERRTLAKKKLGSSEEVFALCVQCAVGEYGLSKREEEIAELVMKGKNNAAIEETLCITESTLRTHLRNIYGKTLVHSRKELIDLLYGYAE